MKRLLLLICTLLCANVLMAQSFWGEGLSVWGEGLRYTITGAGEVEVSGCSNSATSVNIPSSLTVTWIHEEWSDYYDDYITITDTVITYSVTSIDDFAFEDCSSLISVTIPNSVTYIGEKAFRNCSNLTSVNIGNSVTSIREETFRNCSSLTSVNIPNSVTSIGTQAFYDCSSLTSVTIPNSVTSIGEWAFRNCSSLTSVTIGNSVTSIGEATFYNCSSLTSVTIGNSVTSIGNSAFSGCSSLTSVDIPNSVTSIEAGAFYNCSSLTNLNYNAINYNDFDYYDHPFNNCPISTINIGNSVQIIPNYFACGLDSLTSVTIGNSVTSIGEGAFALCSSLTSVTIPNNVTSIGESAFAYCSSLNSITIPNSVTSIGRDAFAYCDNLTTLYYNAINCSDFSYPFAETPITTLLIGNGVQIIPNSFAPISLTEITIPNSVTSIGDYAFGECISLTSVTIPNSVTSIGREAFKYCSSLTSVTSLANTPPALGGSAFDDIGSPSTLYVTNGCRQAYQNSYWAQWFDCIVELGSNNSITNLNIEVNNEEWGSVEVYEGLCGTDTLTAVAEMDCSDFLHWSDGDTNNPRVVNVTSDTSFIAIFKDPVLDTTINATIMQGETYNFNGQELSEEGVYNATVLSVLGCEINLTVNLDVIPNNYTNGETSSLQETELEEIVFYPNPTKGLISFSKTIEKIEVVDISGKILLSFSNVKEINIGDLPAGSYLLRLHSNENSVLRKIVKE